MRPEGMQNAELATGSVEVNATQLTGRDISYRIRGTNDPRNLVFPFYTIPPHEPLVLPDGDE